MSIILRHGILESEVLGGAAPSPSYPTSGLQGRWMFDGDLTDSGPNGYDMTYVNLGSASPSYTTGHVTDEAIYFNTNGGVYTDSISSTFHNTNSYTISYWIYVISPSAPWANVSVMSSRTSDTAQEIRTQNDANVSYMGRSVYVSGVNLTRAHSTWHHIVQTYDGAKFTGFLNDVSIGYTADTNSMGTNLMRHGWGYRVESPSNSKFKGYINAGYVYNRVLTNAEISQLYNGGDGV